MEKVQNDPLLVGGVVEVPQGMASLPLSTERATAASHKANCGASQRPSLLLDARGLCDQELNERTKERFTPLAHVVCELEKPKYSGRFFVASTPGMSRNTQSDSPARSKRRAHVAAVSSRAVCWMRSALKRAYHARHWPTVGRSVPL